MTKLLNITIISGALALSSQAQVLIAEYTFENPTGNLPSLESTDTETFTNAGTFGTGAFNLATTTQTAFTSEGLGLADGTAENLGNAIGNDQFFTFSINAVDGATFSLDNISFDVGRTPNGAQDFFLFSSVGGFTIGADIATALNVGTGGSSISFDFTDSSFDDLEEVEFRVYVDQRTSNSGSSSGTFLDNVLVNAVVTEPIPEPSASMLLGLGGLALLSRRKRG